MTMVLITALGVGGATVIGAIIGFFFKNLSHKFSDIILSFAAGIMLAAAMFGLIIPAMEYGGGLNILVVVAGIFSGCVCINILDKIVPHVHSLDSGDGGRDIGKVLLFVIAIGIHNLPEGIAAGVGFGSGDIGKAFLIAGGIALQNIPEGIVIIAPMLSVGISAKTTFLCALATGLVEVAGTLLGYFAINVAEMILPFALSFAGGTMLYIISDEMIPETHAHGSHRGATYSLIIGFCIMMVTDILLG